MIRTLCIRLTIISLATTAMMSSAIAQQSFLVSDIRVKGLERISAGSIFNYLPVKVGDTFDPSGSSHQSVKLSSLVIN